MDQEKNKKWTGDTYLKNHTAKLGGKQKLLALANQGVDGEVLTHI